MDNTMKSFHLGGFIMRKGFFFLIFTAILASVFITPSELNAYFVCGDANSDDVVDISDAVYIINYAFGGGPAPDPLEAGDANSDGNVDISDAVYIINYAFGGGPEPKCHKIPETTTIIPPDDTTIVQEYDTLTQVITLDESSVYAQEVAVGDVVIGQDEDDAPYGFLRKVSSRTSQGGAVVLETEQATIMEAFENMYISDSSQLLPSDVRSATLHDGVSLLPNKDGVTFNIDLDAVLFEQAGQTVEIQGSYDFEAALFTDIEIFMFTLEKFEIGLETSEEIDLNLTASMEWDFTDKLKVTLAEIHLGAIPVGGVVWITPTLTVEAHIHGDMSVTIETGIVCTQEMRKGLGWENDNFYVISECEKEFTYIPPQFSAEFNFETGASLGLSSRVYGVVGPYVKGEAGLLFQSALDTDPCNFDLSFILDAVVRAVAGIELQCYIFNLDYYLEWDIYNYRIGEWIYPLEGTGTIVIDPEPNSINAPWSLTGPCSYNSNGNGDQTLNDLDPGDYTITWGEVTGWTTPSNSTQSLAADDTLTFSGVYVEDVATGTIVIDPSPDSIDAPWLLEGPNGYSNSGTGDDTLLNLDPGDYTITWENKSGWFYPSDTTDNLTYGETITFVGNYTQAPDSTGTVADYDGNVYQTIKIGDQWWMAENLKVTHYQNGDPIDHVTDGTEWSNLTTGAYCEHSNDPTNAETYGRLYNWYAVDDSRSIAPEGWHVPTDEEWKQLEMYLGMSQAQADDTGWRGTDEGGKLKDTTLLWNQPNAGATNESGFSALPGGCRVDYNGTFSSIGVTALFWSSTGAGSSNAWYRDLNHDSSQVWRTSAARKHDGHSVRCVRD